MEPQGEGQEPANRAVVSKGGWLGREGGWDDLADSAQLAFLPFNVEEDCGLSKVGAIGGLLVDVADVVQFDIAPAKEGRTGGPWSE